MDEEQNNRRMLLAAGLCLLILFVWTSLQPKPPPRKLTDAGVATASVAPDGVAGDVATGTAAVPAEAPAATADVEPQFFGFQGSVRNGDADIPFKLRVSNVGGGIEEFVLTSYRERSAGNEPTDEPISLANPVSELPPKKAAMQQMAAVGFAEGTTFSVPPVPVYQVVDQGGDRIRYRFVTEEGIEIEREYRFREDSFQVEMAVTVRNRSRAEQRHRLQVGAALALRPAMERGAGFFAMFIPPPDHLDLLCHTQGSVERESSVGLDDDQEVHTFKEAVRWIAVDRQYFVSAIVPRDRTDAECRLSAKDKVAQAALILSETTLKPGEERRHKFTAYLGVKKAELLTQVDADLEGAIDYRILGMNLALLCTTLLVILGVFHGWTGSWGLAIVGLTLLVKVVLFPLNQRSMKSMRAMSALKPQIEEMRSKFPDDRQRQSEEMMRLYKEHNVNPAGGCLPILIQMPIWFALYRSLWVSVDLYQKPFLWIGDLTTRDPLWILPVALVVVMFLQQKMTPTTMDPAQQKMMLYTMPLVFGLMMAALPAGLCFYILVNTLLTIVQQHFINRSIGPIGGPAPVRGAESMKAPSGE